MGLVHPLFLRFFFNKKPSILKPWVLLGFKGKDFYLFGDVYLDFFTEGGIPWDDFITIKLTTIWVRPYFCETSLFPWKHRTANKQIQAFPTLQQNGDIDIYSKPLGWWKLVGVSSKEKIRPKKERQRQLEKLEIGYDIYWNPKQPAWNGWKRWNAPFF